MAINQLLHNIKAGKEGRNIGISTGSPKLDSIIYGIQRKYLYTIGADTAGGKTSFVLDTFVYNLLKNAGNTPISILCYSFEMSSDTLYAKLLSRHIWDAYKEVVTYEDILSLTAILTKEHEILINKSKEWLWKISKHLVIYDKSLTPQGIYATCKEWLREHGEFISLGEHKEEYHENDVNEYKVVLFDHVGLISGKGSKKERIDMTVDFMIYFRNKCSLTGIFVQQLNRNAKGMDRKLNGYELVQLDDFKDTSGTTDGSEVVIALYFPYREKIARCEGYPIQNVLKKKFRLCQILKNRYGQSDVNIGMSFYGEIGMFRELPKPEEIGDYEPYLELDYNKKKEEIKEIKDEKHNKNVFVL
jgi:hypothetical protein